MGPVRPFGLGSREELYGNEAPRPVMVTGSGLICGGTLHRVLKGQRQLGYTILGRFEAWAHPTRSSLTHFKTSLLMLVRRVRLPLVPGATIGGTPQSFQPTDRLNGVNVRRVPVKDTCKHCLVASQDTPKSEGQNQRAHTLQSHNYKVNGGNLLKKRL